MPDSKRYYTIQEVSEKLAIPIQKLRRWDQEGVLKAQRSNGGHRRYAPGLIDDLAAQTITPEKTSKELTTIRKSLAESHRIIQLLLESEKRYRDVVETSHDLIWSTDRDGRFTFLSSAARDIFGLSPGELHGRCFFDFEAGSCRIANRRALAMVKQRGELRNVVSRTVTARGERWLEINARVLLDDNKKFNGLRGTIRDITEQRNAIQRVEYLAMHDDVTDLPNRMALEKDVAQCIESSTPGGLLLLEINHCSYVTDDFGPFVGDELLKGVCGALRNLVRDSKGELYRSRGNQFAIHLPDSPHQQAIQLAKRAIDTMQQYRFQGKHTKAICDFSTSVGITLYPSHGSDIERLLSNLDIAIVQAKDRGRNCYALFCQDAKAIRDARNFAVWINKPQYAVARADRLVLFAQPTVRLSDKKTVHHEILIRCRNEVGEILKSTEFMRVFDSHGAIHKLDMQVVKKVLAHISESRFNGTKSRYFVNLSAASISDQKWVKSLAHLISTSTCDPRQLVFELNEVAAIADVDATLRFIENAKDLGSRIALDDFGIGPSSFYYLKRFDPDYIKIRGALIRDLAGDQATRVFVRALNDIASSLRKQVVAQSIETPETLKLLRDLGIQYGQGHLFYKPMPLEKRLNLARGQKKSAA